MTQAVIASAPHAHDSSSVSGVMFNVAVALLPATCFGLYAFGWPAVNLLVVTVASTLAFEAFALWLKGEDILRQMSDNSALVAGWILALTLPPWAPWWIGVLGGALAMLLAKHAFGGIGQNVFNPAMVARVMLLIAFPVEMTTWPLAADSFGPRSDMMAALSVTFGGTIPDGLTGATWLGEGQVVANGGGSIAELSASRDWAAAALGYRTGSMGETSAALLGVGAAIMIWRKVITWHVPVATLLTMGLLSSVTHWLNPEQQLWPVGHLLAGGLLFTSIFIATDPVTSPSTPLGKLIFGAGVALFVFVIRVAASLPEGVGFSVLLMNALVPVIDRNTKPRVYGRTRKGAPLPNPVSEGRRA